MLMMQDGQPTRIGAKEVFQLKKIQSVGRYFLISVVYVRQTSTMDMSGC
jgi:hypothetical protein